jgi:hypothetical protein
MEPRHFAHGKDFKATQSSEDIDRRHSHRLIQSCATIRLTAPDIQYLALAERHAMQQRLDHERRSSGGQEHNERDRAEEGDGGQESLYALMDYVIGAAAMELIQVLPVRQNAAAHNRCALHTANGDYRRAHGASCTD